MVLSDQTFGLDSYLNRIQIWKQEIWKTYRICKYSKKKNSVMMWGGQTINWTCFNKFQRDKRGDKQEPRIFSYIGKNDETMTIMSIIKLTLRQINLNCNQNIKKFTYIKICVGYFRIGWVK